MVVPALVLLFLAVEVPLFLDHVRGLLGDHYDGSVGVASHDFRHNAGVYDSQLVDPVDSEPVVHDGPVVAEGPHPAGSHRMVDGGRVLHHDARPVGVAGKLVLATCGHWHVHQACVDVLHGLGAQHLYRQLDTC